MIDVTTYILARNYADGKIKPSPGPSPDPSGGKEIEIETVSGEIPADKLKELLESSNNLIKCDGKYYRLARIEGNNYKYLNSSTTGSGQVINMTELNVDKETGDFYTKQILIEGSSVEYLEQIVQEHINDNNLHVSSADRINWNNKVSAEAVQIPQSEDDYRLHLKK